MADREALAKEELQEAFQEWCDSHAPIWFPADVEMAEAIAAYLNISIDFDIAGGDTDG